MISWVWKNKQWLFSGIGLAAITSILSIYSFNDDNETTNSSKNKQEKIKKIDPKSDTPYYVSSDDSYLYSVQEPMRALMLYREAYTISSGAIDEADLTAKYIKRKIQEIENSRKDELSEDDKTTIRQLKINLDVFLTVRDSLIQVVKIKQEHLAKISAEAEKPLNRK